MDDTQIAKSLIRKVNDDVNRLMRDLKSPASHTDRLGYVKSDLQLLIFDRGVLTDYDHGEINELLNTVADDLSSTNSHRYYMPTIYEVYLNLDKYLKDHINKSVINKLRADLKSYNNDVKHWSKDDSYVE